MAKPYTLKKSLGQHFLHDEQICERIVGSLTVKPKMNLLEIGPGGGAITKYLINIEDINYKAIEVDEEKVRYLEKTYKALEGKIIEQDILQANAPYEGKFSIIGNFPYNISSPILFKVLDWEEDVEEVIGMFQKEVALRVASDSGSKQYGILSVLIGAFFKVDYLFDVDEQAFTPPPKVKSGVIRLTNLNNPHGIIDKRKFKVLVKTAFNQRRKMLRNALAGILPKEVLEEHPFMTKRAEQLSIEDFVSLYKAYFS
ncbi:MAG: 16S rRNA (adenine(1518)-N(6)/adenine(1519)-N(6))-dimethyltransferase RsmA [Flavipsychrobacter sp.]